MVEKARASVILTSYNHAKYLRESIESILDQSFSAFELIIIDDASTDESWQIIESYTDPRIRAIGSTSTNVIRNLRRAISEATGEYVAIHHSDDAWERQKLATQVAFLEEHADIGAVFSRALIIGENGEPLEDKSHFYQTIFDQSNRSRWEWLNFFFHHGNALCHPSVLIRKKCYAECGPYRYGFMQTPDLDMWVRLCLKYEIHVLSERLIRFRVRSNESNTSGNRPEVRVRAQFEFLEILDNYRRIDTRKEFIEVFPAASVYFEQEAFDVGFALAMMALGPKTSNATKLFGLRQLFQVLSDPERATRIRRLYDFDHGDFLALTGAHDVFSSETAAQLASQVQTLSAQLATSAQRIDRLASQVQTLSAQLATKAQGFDQLASQVQTLSAQLATTVQRNAEREEELSRVYRSTSWRYVQRLRQIRSRLVPYGSLREKVALWVMRGWRRVVSYLLDPHGKRPS